MENEAGAAIKPKKKHIGLWIFLGILGVLLIFVAVHGIRWAVHKQEPADGYGDYLFDGGNTAFDLDLFPSLVIAEDATELRIMQIADAQIKTGWTPERDRRTMRLLETAFASQKPDICVVTGDLAMSIFTYDAYKSFADFMQKQGVMWTMVYGNHDSQFDCSKYTLYEMLSGYDNCLFSRGPSDIHGESNFLVNVYRGEKRADRLAYSLVMLDSGMYPDSANGVDWVYDWIRNDQMAWYEWAVNGLRSIRSDIQTSMFFHMPIKEYADLYYLNERANGMEIPEAVAAKLPDLPISDVTGVVRENDKSDTEVVYGDDGYTVGIFYQGNEEGTTDHPDVFAKIKELDCTKAVFCGHDHVNNLKGYLDGIYLAYGLCCGYHTYPFFDSCGCMADKILVNGALWVDENGEPMEKGVTMINVSLGSDYGKLDVKDKPASSL